MKVSIRLVNPAPETSERLGDCRKVEWRRANGVPGASSITCVSCQGYLGDNLSRLKWQCSTEGENLPMRKRIVFAAFLLSTCGVFVGNGVGQEAKKPFTKPEILRLLNPTPGTRYEQGDLAGDMAQRGVAFQLDAQTLDELR